ncbi:hypothetical protein RO3G_10271 [Rhizopus delemar RA 99-880]|uniref:BPL/LPL catalytic domain-containing protein n=1 Tax=Rhizopus delemar (strain RA 99-880 / ATCC MYA-4621 / FGSC 9543 / NRRL 43880) TaxID=246409 RepID=I1CAT1_RHIO9|nr:hypothetical protein RO3G_10271 [Rhizopus delemar RA 99-880]|eukprot:EIE85561.1 hypothetical protein RO3G_10271 [Rhizopus delemar RA 99-880]
MPGGRDLPYCEALNGQPNDRINQYVRKGGLYLGICAGAYYASQQIEFEKDNPVMEIIQPRELGFYPGLCRGTTFPGFVYNSESGARSVVVLTEKEALCHHYLDIDVPSEIKMYYNGGGYFVHPEKYNNVTVLCRFKEHGPRCTDEPEGPTAIVHCKVDQGDALLIATHPEYDVSSEDLLSFTDNSEKVCEILKDLVLSEVERKRFLCAALSRVGLKVVPFDNHKIPLENKTLDVTPFYLSGLTNEWVYKPTSYLIHKIDRRSCLLKDSHDIFYVNELDSPPNEQARILSLCRIKEGKSAVIEIIYPNTVYTAEPICPPLSLTPHFNMKEYYRQLCQKRESHQVSFSLGNGLLYAEVISSTQTVLEKNPTLLRGLPTGFVCLGSNQIAGRVESIRERHGYESIPLRLKWPNDIYVECKNGELKKVGGILMNSSFTSDEFVLVIGCGLNLSNTLPTVSINDIVKDCDPSLKALSAEDVLAGIMVKFEINSIVTLTTQNNEKVKVVGITPDHGMLKVKSLDRLDKFYGLLPDGNRFDMMKGLLVQKI